MNDTMKVRDLLKIIDKIAPFDTAEEWDNVGLMAGDLNGSVSRVAVTLDPVSEAVTAAAERGCQVLLCHHPLIFHPVKKIDFTSDPGRAIREAALRGVSILAAHTNWDCAGKGVNAVLANLLDLRDAAPLDTNTGLGAKGLLPETLPLNLLLKKIKDAWGLTRLDCYAPGPESNSVTRVALCGGSGSEFWRDAKSWGADLYVTADMKYHELMDANGAGLTVALADHGEMERASLPSLARLVSEACGLEVILLDIKGLNAPIRI